jgi:hypothetical protein
VEEADGVSVTGIDAWVNWVHPSCQDIFTYQVAAYRQWQATGDAAVIRRADQITRPIYQQRNFGEDYVYVKILQKEPFDILYFNLWVSAFVNLQPGMTWAPVTDPALNLRVGIPVGSDNTEFGEKPDVFRPEFWVRYYLYKRISVTKTRSADHPVSGRACFLSNPGWGSKTS